MSDQLFDLETPRSVLITDDASRVPMSIWILDAWLAIGDQGEREFVLVSPDGAALSPLLAAKAKTVGGFRWIIDHPEGSYDGITGHRVTWTDGAFLQAQSMHPGYEQRHGNSRALQLTLIGGGPATAAPGRIVESVLAELGSRPLAYGLFEPFDRDFAALAGELPGPGQRSFGISATGGVLGSLELERSEDLVELMTLTMPLSSPELAEAAVGCLQLPGIGFGVVGTLGAMDGLHQPATADAVLTPLAWRETAQSTGITDVRDLSPEQAQATYARYLSRG